MELVRDGDRVIGTVTYVASSDTWKAESVHQTRPQTFYSESRAEQWIRQLHAEETGQGSES